LNRHWKCLTDAPANLLSTAVTPVIEGAELSSGNSAVFYSYLRNEGAVYKRGRSV